MANINKDSAMLLDIQYIKAKRGEHTDYLYTIWKDLDTGEKHLDITQDPTMEIYFEKDEFRNHNYNKTYVKKENANKVVCEYKKITNEIIKDMGEAGQNLMQDIYNTKNYDRIKEFTLYPYVFGSDQDIRVFYRQKWLEQYDNNRVKPLTKGFLDIEVDTLESIGLPSPELHPIDLTTIIDTSTHISYTFCLTGVTCIEKDISRMTKQSDIDYEMKRRSMYELSLIHI